MSHPGPPGWLFLWEIAGILPAEGNDMSVIVMEVFEVNQHPNADALRVYQLGAGTERVQVVANLSSTYQVGDKVAIATVGSELKDGTKIRPARLRGVDSFGMALGLHGAAVGSDVTPEFCVASAEPTPNTAVISWPSIELLHHVRAGLRTLSELQGTPLPRVGYRAKVKLDGTNGGVQVHPDGRVLAQSRSQVLDLGADNMGFGRWVAENAGYFAALAREQLLVVFGEWCGQGIQKRAAISQISRKVFVVFAAQFGDGVSRAARVEVEPARLRELLPPHPDVFVLPWVEQAFELDFADDEQSRREAERISAEVVRIEAEDPWVAASFGVSGVGEGIVLYPQQEGAAVVDRQRLSELMFKAKGEKHQAVRQKQAAQLEPEVAQGIAAFVELVLAEPRLEQGVTEACQGKPEMPKLGAFLRWIAGDVQKECGAELAAAGLSWDQVNRAVSASARSWFTRRLER
jgi:tRNA-binding EMAP/Myf-like protein